MRGVGNVLTDGITRWKEDDMHNRLAAECPTFAWQAQELGVEGSEICWEILHAATRSDEL